MKRKHLTLTMAFTLAIISAALITPAAVAAEDMDGKALFTETYKCDMCHSVPAAEIESKIKSESMKGPDFGGKIEADFETIAGFVRKKADKDGAQHKKEFKGTDEELQTILDWLGSLEAQE